ncbi:hypothetical protein D3C81_1282620 [compost metagenome]
MDPRSVRIELSSIPRRYTSVIVRESLILGDDVNDIHAEAVNAFSGPEQHHLIHRSANLFVLPVQIRLSFVVQREIILA